jgi:hypothetical protein
MLRVCGVEGCETKTLGSYCIDHEHVGGLSEALHSAAAAYVEPIVGTPGSEPLEGRGADANEAENCRPLQAQADSCGTDSGYLVSG